MTFFKNELRKYGISDYLINHLETAEKRTEQKFREIDSIYEINQLKVLRAFLDTGISEYHLNGSTGYGLNDEGRSAVDEVCARIFRSEKAILRWQFVSGTHAISSVLFGNLSYGDEVISITGTPYDTLNFVTGNRFKVPCSLKESNIEFTELEFDGYNFDFDRISSTISKKSKMIYIQRSAGYAKRRAINSSQIREICQFVKNINKEIIIMVDNCYGEFVEETEPIEEGADIVAGSLIKNFGGSLAPCGGYISGKEEYVIRASYRLTAPGIGQRVGATMDFNRTILQGIFFAPQIVRESLKGAVLTASLLNELNIETFPSADEKRADIIQGLVLNSSVAQEKFARGIQKASCIDSKAYPISSPQPGYSDNIIMAGGTFIQGSSIEFSADGPQRPPYYMFVQGGTTLVQNKIGILFALQELLNAGFLKI